MYDQPTEVFAGGLLPPGQPKVPKVKRRRVRGLRVTALPSWPLLAQAGGGISALSGVYLQFGGAVTLIVGGVVALALGTLREAGRI